MLPLTLDDLISLEEYASRRREFFESHHRYLDRYRRVRIGPRLTLIFENRQTLWFRVQEVIRIARLTETAHVQQELDLYNRLLPERDCLQAAMVIEVLDETQLVQELAPWREFHGDQVRLHLGEQVITATLVTSRPEDRATGCAHWLQFTLDALARRFLADAAHPAFFQCDSPFYQFQSAPLNEDVRQSLLDDLVLSDRDSARAG
jgi:hypothetical protein